MQIAKKIVGIIVTLLLGIIVTYNVYNLYSLKVLHKDLATVNGYGILEVVSGSMEPTIHVGDMIIINTKDKNYQEGNIITFYDKDGAFVTHRIIEIDDDKIITQGDNNDSEDNYDLSKDKIVGKYVWRLGGAGKLLAAFKSPLTMIMILIIGILACILVSTDKDGNPILSTDEKEFEEFLEYKNAQEKMEISKTKAEEQKENKSTKEPKKIVTEDKTTKSTVKTKTASKPKSNATKKKSTSTTSKTTSKKATVSESPKKKVTNDKNKSTASTKKKKSTTTKKKTSTSKTKKK